MDGCMDGQTDGKMGGWVDGLYERKDGSMDDCGWMDGDGWMDGWMNGWMDGWTKNGFIDRRTKITVNGI